MIELGQHYRFVFSIGGFYDFISYGQLVSFLMIEEVGNVLPTFQLEVDLIEEDVIRVMNEGNVLQVAYGRDMDSMVTTKLRIMRLDTTNTGADKRKVVVKGFFDAVNFLNSSRQRIFKDRKSIDVIREVVGDYFRFLPNKLTCQDNQTWIQPSISDKKFVNELWLHMDAKSVPLVGISSDGEFIMKGIDELNDSKWTLHYGSLQGDTYIPYDNDYSVEVRSGFINAWYGYGRSKKLYEWEEGNQSLTEEEAEVFMAHSKYLNRDASSVMKYDNASFLNDNVHPNYWKSYMKNMSYLAVGSSVKLTVRTTDYFFPVKVLDTAVILDQKMDMQPRESSTFLAGRYVISKVCRSISANTYAMTLEMHRDALNMITGALKKDKTDVS